MVKIKFQKASLKNIPESPGVYLYYTDDKIIYVGKAKNLKKRITSYFSLKLLGKTRKMIYECNFFSLILVNSELEALLLEANLIKKYQPFYNFIAKDDKHPLYLKITREKYPRVLTVRKNGDFGPFPSSQTVRSVLRMLRKIFPFSDHNLGKSPCLNSQIGLCRPCPNEIERIVNKKLKTGQIKKYRDNIKILKNILSGKVPRVKKELYKKMEQAAQKENFEEANRIKIQIADLNYITQPIIPQETYLQNPNLLYDIRNRELKEFKKILKNYFPNLKSVKRIECYDAAHLSGTYPTASMVTFTRGQPEKSSYRHFRLQPRKPVNDLAYLAEVGKRRRKNTKLEKPDLILVDGGKGQIKVFAEIFARQQIPIVGITKKEEVLLVPYEGKYAFVRLKASPALALVQRLRNEAHRFAQKYHHLLIRRAGLTILKS